MKKRKTNIFFQISALLVMIAIFYFSSQSGGESSGLSLKVTRLFSRLLFFEYRNFGASPVCAQTGAFFGLRGAGNVRLLFHCRFGL